MMTIICGTNRAESNTFRVLEFCVKTAADQGIDATVLNLEDIPENLFFEGRYGSPVESFTQILDKKIVPASHILFVVPEYNGSYPGILKLFIDIAPPALWAGKKAALLGVATGRSGNQRGLDHLMMVLHYLNMEVYSQKPLLSSIHHHISEDGDMRNEEYQSLIENQIRGFRKF